MLRSPFLLIGIFTTLLLVGAGCAKTPSQSDEIRIGAALGLTGDAAAWAEAEKNAITLAMEDRAELLKRKNIKVLFEDTGSSNTKGISALTKLITVDKAQVILGPSWLDSYGGPAPLSDQYKTVMVTPSAVITAVKTEPNQYPNIFSTWFSGDGETRELVRYLAEAKHKKIAIVVEQDPYWNDVAKQVRQWAQEKGVEVVLEEKMNPNETDFRSVMAKVKAATPDAMVFGFSKERGWLNFLKQRQESFSNIPLYSVGGAGEFMGQPRFEGLFSDVYITVPRVHDEGFKQRYFKRFGVDTIFCAANAYDAANMVLDAIDQGHVTTEAIRSYLTSQTFQTVSFGEVRFNQMGGVDAGVYDLVEYRDGKKQVVQTP